MILPQPLLGELSGLLGMLVLLTALYLQSQTFVDPTIRGVAAQSLFLAFLFVILFLGSGDVNLLYLAAITAGIRGLLIPAVMLYQVRRFKHSLRESGSGQRVPSLVIVGVIVVIGGYALFKTVLLPTLSNPSASVPFVLVLLSLLLMATRRNALTQMTGFLEEENAVLYAGALVAPSIPLLIEFAVVLDILGVILVGVILSATRDVLRLLDEPELEQLTG